MSQQVASKLANSVRQAKDNQAAGKTAVAKKPAAAAKKDDEAPLPKVAASRRVWPD